MRNKKWIAAALVCGFVLGNSMPAAQAGIRFSRAALSVML